MVGPTASGKTRLGIELAERLGGEIISADSQQVYQDLEIGTAKPTADERARVRHHLVDCISPGEVLSAGEFARRADAAVLEIASRGRLPIVVGGTGLWVRALLQGLVEVPQADPELRARLEAVAAREGKEAMHARLAALDAAAAAQIPVQNLVFVLRALELYELTGERPSELKARHAFSRLRYHARVLGLSPSRELLYRRIDARAKAMFAQGLVAEVARLVEAGHRDAPAMKALGYRQALGVLDQQLDLPTAISLTARDCRHYAKRQLTWFRADPLVEWLPWPAEPAALADGLAQLGWRGESR